MQNPLTDRVFLRIGVLTLAVGILFFLISGCESIPDEGENDHRKSGVLCATNCGDVFNPVCSENGETYMNPCLAECANAKVIEGDECMLCEKTTTEYQAIGMEKVRLLNEYINLILINGTNNKDGTPSEIVDTAINEAVKLFINEEASVEIINGGGSKFFRIREYLNRIKNYSPTRRGEVEIKWSEIGYVSKLKPGPDRNFYGVITVTQKFKRSLDSRTTYEDITRKNIEVVLQTYTLA